MANYVNNMELWAEICLSNYYDELTPAATKMLLLMIEKVGHRFNSNTNNTDFSADCSQHAAMQIFKNWRCFDIQYKYRYSCFAYYTEIIKRGYAAGFKQITRRKGDPDNLIKTYSIETACDGDGMYKL